MANARELAQRVEDLQDDVEDASMDGLKSGMTYTKQEARRNIRRNDSNVTGGLGDSIGTERGPIDGYRLAYRTTIDAQYAPFVEYGTGLRQASFLADTSPAKFKSPDPAPPLGRIRQWIVRKGITANDPELRRRNLTQTETFTNSRGNKETITAEQANLAYAIRDSIAEFGNSPHPFARPAARDGFDVTTNRVRSNLREAIRRF